MKNSQFKILHLSTSKFRGAGIAAFKLHLILENAGMASFFLSKESESRGYLYQILANIRKRFISDRYWNSITNKNKNQSIYCLHSINDYKLDSFADKILKETPFTPNVIFIHWVSGFINAKTIREIAQKTNARIIWTMMDNAPITGGCHYPWSCVGYEQECGFCPGLKDKKAKTDNSFYTLSQKKSLLKDIDISILCFSEGDYSRALRSKVFNKEKIYKTFLPVNKNNFTPHQNIQALKKRWGIPMGKRILLIGASNVQDERKGLSLFYDAWQQAILENCLILLVGKADNKYIKQLGKNVIFRGSVKENELIECYQIADFFICPSLEDSGPYMINQSLTCGTPIISFNIGIAIDLVKTDKTGYNCGKPSVNSLIKGLKYACTINDSQLKGLKTNCRQVADKELNDDKFIQSIYKITL